jgi:hypothetical protein
MKQRFLYRTNVVARRVFVFPTTLAPYASAVSNLLFYGVFLVKEGLPRRQKTRAAARNDINSQYVR